MLVVDQQEVVQVSTDSDLCLVLAEATPSQPRLGRVTAHSSAAADPWKGERWERALTKQLAPEVVGCPRRCPS